MPPPPMDFSQDDRRFSGDWDEFEPGDEEEKMNTLGRNKKFKLSYTPTPSEKEMEALRQTAQETTPTQEEGEEADKEEPPPVPLTLPPDDDEDRKPFNLEDLDMLANNGQPKDMLANEGKPKDEADKKEETAGDVAEGPTS